MGEGKKASSPFLHCRNIWQRGYERPLPQIKNIPRAGIRKCPKKACRHPASNHGDTGTLSAGKRAIGFRTDKTISSRACHFNK